MLSLHTPTSNWQQSSGAGTLIFGHLKNSTVHSTEYILAIFLLGEQSLPEKLDFRPLISGCSLYTALPVFLMEQILCK